MLTLDTPPENILGNYCLTQGRLLRFGMAVRHEAPHDMVIIHAEGWSDMVQAKDGDPDAAIVTPTGPKRLVFIPMRIELHGVHSMALSLTEHTFMDKHVSTLTPAERIEYKHILESFAQLGLPSTESIRISEEVLRPISLTQFAIERANAGTILDAHNCSAGRFHLRLNHPQDLAALIIYDHAIVHIGHDILELP